MEHQINWHLELMVRGFKLVETSTRTYSHRGLEITGSVTYETAELKVTPDGQGKYEIFCPFKEGKGFQSERIRNLTELDKFLYQT